MSRTRIALRSLALTALLSACGDSGPRAELDDTPLAPPPGPPENELPIAAFSSSVAAGIAPLTVDFDASASFDRDGNIVNYAWSFGDGADGNGTTTKHVFADPGNFEVTLTVTDDAGATDSAQTTVIIAAQSGFRVSGAIRIANASVVDSDVNDRATTPVRNNSFAQAQDLSNPATLGGYVNVPGAGTPGGNSTADGDVTDMYRVPLRGGEVIRLDVGDLDGINDLDLRLWNDAGQLVDASLSATGTEALRVAEPGTYFVEVLAFAGASNYVLSLGGADSSSPFQTSSWRVSTDFVPYQALFRSTGVGLASSLDPVRPVAASGAVRLGLLPRAEASAIRQLDEGWSGSLNVEQRARYETLLGLKRLARDDRFDAVEPNYLHQPHGQPNDELFGRQWHHVSVSLPEAWDVTTGSGDVTIAVIDTGVRSNHPDLVGQLEPGFDFVSDPESADDGDGIDSIPDDPGDRAYVDSSSYHGTHVAGIVAAVGENGIGVTGAAWGARILPLRAIGIGGGTSFDIIQAVQHAAGMASAAPEPLAEPVDVINLSLGSPTFSSNEQQVYDEVRARGVLVVASAGNGGIADLTYPAGYAGVVSVGATTINNTRTTYSNFGPGLDLVAPGGDMASDVDGDGFGDGILSTMAVNVGDNVQLGYGYSSGTSMAAPQVAAAAALMLSVHPELTPAEFEQMLANGDLTDDLGSPGRDDDYGYGLINAQKAVEAASVLAGGGATSPSPRIVAAPTTVELGAILDRGEVVLTNVGGGTAAVIDIAVGAPWLSLLPAAVDAAGLGRYDVLVDRTALSDGFHQAAVTFTTDTGAVQVEVRTQMSSLGQSTDAGRHTVVLVDATTGVAVVHIAATAESGAYVFDATGVPGGTYRILAGTDRDFDGSICDSGESCGAFPTLDQPEVIVIDADRTGLDFVTTLRAIGSGAGVAAPSAEEALDLEGPDEVDGTLQPTSPGE